MYQPTASFADAQQGRCLSLLPSFVFALLHPQYVQQGTPAAARSAELLKMRLQTGDDALMSLDELIRSLVENDAGTLNYLDAMSPMLLEEDEANQTLRSEEQLGQDKDAAEAKMHALDPCNSLINQLAAFGVEEEQARPASSPSSKRVLDLASIIDATVSVLPHLSRMYNRIAQALAVNDRLPADYQAYATSHLTTQYITLLHLDEDGWSHEEITAQLLETIDQWRYVFSKSPAAGAADVFLPSPYAAGERMVFAVRRLLVEEQTAALLDCPVERVVSLFETMRQGLVPAWPIHDIEGLYMDIMMDVQALAAQNSDGQLTHAIVLHNIEKRANLDSITPLSNFYTALQACILHSSSE
ncbi:hypothetical protein RI367_003162 [Sorochytrium milnesiophthora]